MTIHFDSKLITCFALLILMLSACSTLKSKQRLVQKGYESIGAKGYGSNGMAEISDTFRFKDFDLSKSVLRKTSKRQIRERLKNIEKFFAMLPDSLVANGIDVDSFYTNQSKITYIEARSLQTKNIHFLR